MATPAIVSSRDGSVESYLAVETPSRRRLFIRPRRPGSEYGYICDADRLHVSGDVCDDAGENRRYHADACRSTGGWKHELLSIHKLYYAAANVRLAGAEPLEAAILATLHQEGPSLYQEYRQALTGLAYLATASSVRAGRTLLTQTRHGEFACNLQHGTDVVTFTGAVLLKGRPHFAWLDCTVATARFVVVAFGEWETEKRPAPTPTQEEGEEAKRVVADVIDDLDDALPGLEGRFAQTLEHARELTVIGQAFVDASGLPMVVREPSSA